MTYRRHKPEESVFYKVVQDHLGDFLAAAREHDGVGLPRFIETAFRAFLVCGRLEAGFVRLQCGACGHEEVVAFSCKKRGACTSCMGRMMADDSAHLVDNVLPAVPYRQWVVGYPFDVMKLLAFHPDVLVEVERMAQQHILRFMEKRSDGKGGGVLVRHRMGSALNVAPHLHLLIADGAWRDDDELGFHVAPPLTVDALTMLCGKIAAGLKRILMRRKLVRAGDDSAQQLELDALGAATQHAMTVGRREKRGPALALVGEEEVETPQGKLAVRVAGLNLYASDVIDGKNREALERLARYLLRPPFSTARFSQLDDGMIAYRMKKADRKGNTVLVLSPMEVLSRIASLIPAPRRPLHRFFGVFGPNAKLRRKIVVRATHRRPRGTKDELAAGGVAYRQPMAWSELLKRTFQIDVTVCKSCGKHAMGVVAYVKDRDEAARYLAHTGLAVDRLIRGPPTLAA